MKDSDLRAIVLQRFYDLRKTGRMWKLTPDELGGMEESEFERIGDQLGEQGYIQWINSIDGGYGAGQINARGIDVVEGNAHPSIAITMHDQSVKVHGSTNVQIGSGNTIKTSADVARIEQEIDRMPITDHEKAETKSLLSRISNNASFASLMGAIATVMSTSAH